MCIFLCYGQNFCFWNIATEVKIEKVHQQSTLCALHAAEFLSFLLSNSKSLTSTLSLLSLPYQERLPKPHSFPSQRDLKTTWLNIHHVYKTAKMFKISAAKLASEDLPYITGDLVRHLFLYQPLFLFLPLLGPYEIRFIFSQFFFFKIRFLPFHFPGLLFNDQIKIVLIKKHV